MEPNLLKVNVFSIVKFIFVFSSKYRSTYVSYWAVKTLGDFQSSRGIDPGVKCKIHTTPILMHQMHISITYISSMMLRSKNLKIRDIMTVKTQTDCRQMEPNPLKDRAS
jgi:hypothetical protein